MMNATATSVSPKESQKEKEEEQVTLLLVDIQKDFHPGGSLAIPTANEDSHRVATLIKTHQSKIKRVVATMDSHLKLHIANPGFWVSGEEDENHTNDCNKKRRHPDPFTVITSQDIANGKWKPRDNLYIPPGTIDSNIFGSLESLTKDHHPSSPRYLDLTKYAMEYTKRLEDSGKFQLVVWPEHCLVGSVGFSMVDEVMEALQEWSETTGGSIEWVLKGQNLLTESYSALEAEVPVNQATSLNKSVIASLTTSDRLLICGQAMSHCVHYTTANLVHHWPKDKLSNITLLTDCASSVPGFEAAGDKFQDDMAKAGVLLKKSTEVFS